MESVDGAYTFKLETSYCFNALLLAKKKKKKGLFF